MATKKRLIADALKKYHDSKFTPGVYEHSIFGKAAMLLEVDAVEVVHGRWDGEYLDPRFICSECGKWFLVEDATGNMNYCPNCGAKMDGDGNGS